MLLVIVPPIPSSSNLFLLHLFPPHPTTISPYLNRLNSLQKSLRPTSRYNHLSIAQSQSPIK